MDKTPRGDCSCHQTLYQWDNNAGDVRKLREQVEFLTSRVEELRRVMLEIVGYVAKKGNT